VGNVGLIERQSKKQKYLTFKEYPKPKSHFRRLFS